MADALKVAINGLGAIGQAHIKGFQGAGAVIVAAADPAEPAREKTKAAVPGIKLYESLEAMLKAGGFDAVVVATPNKFHPPNTIAAIKAGFHVLCEKPIATNRTDADKMVAAADKAGKVLMIGTQFRLLPVSRKIRSLVDAGYFGGIYHARASVIRQRGIPGMGGWFTNREVAGGGAIYDIGIHTYDHVWYCMGCPEPVAVSAMTYSKFMDMDAYVYSGMWAGPPKKGGTCDVDDAGFALVRYANGASMLLEVTWAANRPNEAMRGLIMGDKKGASWEAGKDTFTVVGQDEKSGLVEETQVSFDKAGYPDRWQHFIECVQKGVPCLVSGSDIAKVQAVLDAVYQSSEKGAEVRIE
ncbi:MAG: Gfo/Idh/MocA family oxidoreductase [Planctomycetota bacterium]